MNPQSTTKRGKQRKSKYLCKTECEETTPFHKGKLGVWKLEQFRFKFISSFSIFYFKQVLFAPGGK
jgi:hypothetical protein